MSMTMLNSDLAYALLISSKHILKKVELTTTKIIKKIEVKLIFYFDVLATTIKLKIE